MIISTMKLKEYTISFAKEETYELPGIYLNSPFGGVD